MSLLDIHTWEPQPYASLDIDDFLYFNPHRVEEDMLGTGDQRRMQVGASAFDPYHHHLYVLELFADKTKPIVNVWKITDYSYRITDMLHRQGKIWANKQVTLLCNIQTSTSDFSVNSVSSKLNF
jgi:hypothetical protein